MKKMIAALAVTILMSAPALAADALSPYAQKLKDKALKGDGPSAYNLALCYHEGGKDCPQSDADAAQWLIKAAALNDVAAMVNLGDFYHTGLGVKQDDGQALTYYRAGAGFGNADAEYNLGTFYANGYGTKADQKQAIGWYERAGNQGLADAQIDLAKIYMQMQPPDYENAYFWFAVAANSKSDQAAQAATFRDRIRKVLTTEQYTAQAAKVQAWHAKPEGEGYDQRRGGLH
jgi:uncharacterized protein